MPCANDAFWSTRDTEIRYHDLEDRHLGNIVRMLERQLNEAKGPFYGSDSELESFDSMIEEKQEQLVDLKKEQKRRTPKDILGDPGKRTELDRMREESLARIDKRTAQARQRNRRRGDPT